MGAVDRPAARRYFEHDWALDRIHGDCLPAGSHADGEHRAGTRVDRGDRNGYAAAVYNVAADAGCPGISSLTSMECIPSNRRKRGCFRCFRGLHLHSRASRWDFFFLTIGRRRTKRRWSRCLGAAGIALFYLAGWLDARPKQLFAVYDYWHTSPNFFLARVAILLILFPVSYVWCRWVATRFLSVR